MGPVPPAAPGSAQAPVAEAEGGGCGLEQASSDAQQRGQISAASLAQRWSGPGIAARLSHFPARCGHFQPQRLSRADTESAGGRGSSCCQCTNSTLAPPPMFPHGTRVLAALRQGPLCHSSSVSSHSCSLVSLCPSGNSLGTRNKCARLAGNRAGVRLGWTGACLLCPLSTECHLCTERG